MPKKCPKKSQTRDKSTGRCRTKRNLNKSAKKSIVRSPSVGQQRMAEAIRQAEIRNMMQAEARNTTSRNVVEDVLAVPEQMAATLPINPLANIQVSRQSTRQGPMGQQAVIAQNFAELPLVRASLKAEQERQQRMKDYQREIYDEL